MALARLYQRHAPVILGMTGVLVVGLAWEFVARFQLANPVLVSSPSRVFLALERGWSRGLLDHLAVSSTELVLGFVPAVLVGIPVGAIMARHWLAEAALEPFLWFLYTIPLVALWPLFIIWFGLGTTPNTVLAFLFAVVPIIINTLTGVKNIDPILIRCARSFNARPSDLFVKILVPAALPLILAGLRLAMGRALIGVVVGELFSGQAGLGYYISYWGARLRFDDVFAGLLLVVALGQAGTQLIGLLELRVARWKA